jgi:hypothetical protein
MDVFQQRVCAPNIEHGTPQEIQEKGWETDAR